jgi:three-Cys-motif partner protein
VFKLPTPKDDGLFIPSVKEHSSDKHYYLMRYIDAFTTSMKDKWGALHYIDLFAGAGIEKLENSKKLDWGSPMIAAQTRYKFAGLHLCEKNSEKHEALLKRVISKCPNAQIIHGDANDMIHEIINNIPIQGALSLAFLDPYGLHLDFETLRILAERKADLIIFFPDHIDALRNWEHYYLHNPNSNLDRCLGPGSNWRSIIDKASPDRRAEVLRSLYVERLGSLGYTKFEYQRIESTKGHPLYCLIFCSGHKLAAKLWREIAGKEPDGQRTFKFDQP